MSKVYAAIMAGGTGTRLWPKSRERFPKQLHKFISQNSLLQDTVADIKDVIPEKNVLINTGKRYQKDIQKQLPKVKHYFLEPYRLGKTLTIGLTALYLAKLDPKAVMVLLWADSYIGKKTAFKKVLKQGIKFAKAGRNLIIGVKPNYASTGLGYIQMGKRIRGKLYQLKSFKEKPDAKTAKRYVASGKFVWNPGISIWRVDKLLDLYRKYASKYYGAIMQFEDEMLKRNLSGKLAKAYKNIAKTEIEDTIYPKAKNLGVIPSDIGWNDIGHWGSLHEILSKKDIGNVVVGEHLGIDSKGCVVNTQDRLIVTIGLKNIVVVDTDDVILVCQRDRTQDVKKVVEILEQKGKRKYL